MTEIQITLTAVDKASAEIRKVAASLDKKEGLAEKAKTASIVMTGLSSAMTVANQVARTAGQIYGATVGAVIDYNKSVLDLADSVGTGTEEMSRLIQVSDDFGISQESLKTALQMMTKNGLQPTIENLAGLSDEFNGMADPVERAEKMSKLLGRNWATLTPLLKAGGSAIKTMASEVSDSLIVTEESVKASEEWRLQVDELNDTLQGVGLTIGKAIIPVLSSAAGAFTVAATATEKHIATLQEHNITMIQSGVTYAEYRAEMERAAGVMKMQIDDSGNLVDAYGRIQQATVVLTESQYENAEIQSEMAAGYAAMKANIEGTDAATSGLNDTTATATDLMKGYNTQLLYAIASQGLSEEAAIALADSMGLIDDKTKLAYDATADYKTELDGSAGATALYNERIRIMQDLLEGLDGKKYKTVFELQADIDEELYQWYEFLDNQSKAGSGGGGGEQEFAGGGSFIVPPGYPNDSFRLGGGVMAQSGERVTVDTARDSGGSKGSGGGVVVNITSMVSNPLDQLSLEQRLVKAIRKYTQ